MKKVVIIVTKKSLFTHSGVGKYISNYIPFLKEKFDTQVIYQPESPGIIPGRSIFWRFFILPKIINKKYKDYIKIFFDENFLISARLKYAESTIAIVHHYPFKTNVTNLKENMVRRLSFITFNTILRKIKHIIAVSNQTKDILKSIGIKENYITVIPNSVDISSYKILDEKNKNDIRNKISKKYNIPSNKKRLLYVGSNESRKNLTTLFKVLSKLPEDYVLVRIGKDGSNTELQKMNKIINENNLRDRYYHFQNLSESELISLYQISDIYIMTSLYEGFGRPIIEAQACGCPVISTKSGSLGEICGDGALLIDNPLDENEYIEKIFTINKVKKDLLVKGKANAENYSILKHKDLFIKTIENI